MTHIESDLFTKKLNQLIKIYKFNKLDNINKNAYINT